MHIWKQICAHFEKICVNLGEKVFVHIWKQLCAHLGKDLLGILQFAFMPARADNDAFGRSIWR